MIRYGKNIALHLFPVYLEITIKLPFKFPFKQEQRFTVDYSMEVVYSSSLVYHIFYILNTYQVITRVECSMICFLASHILQSILRNFRPPKYEKTGN